MPSKKKAKNSAVLTVDMTGVEAGGVVAEGDYGVKVAKVEHKIAESSGKPMLVWEFDITEGGTGKLWYNTSLQPQALFNLKNVLICLGVSVPDGKMKLDLDEYLDMECGVTVGHEVYDGKKRARIVDIWPLDEAEYKDDDEEEDDDDSEDDEDEYEDEEDDEDEGPDYSALNKKALKELCRTRKIKVSKDDDKDALIAKLEAADEEEDI